MAQADTDGTGLERELGALTARIERLESLRQRFVDTGPSLALIGANIAVILFVVVQLMNFDGRVDEIEDRMTAVEQELSEVNERLDRIEDALAQLLER